MATEFKLTLENGTTIIWEEGLDGGGLNHLPDFINAISTHGKPKYKHGVEWCAGFGVIGYHFLTSDICERMSFIDCYEPAISNINKTAGFNNLTDRVTTYHSDEIGKIVTNEKWDLLVANPPHCFTSEVKQWLIDNNHGDHTIRITCDEDLKIHEEFFNNIADYMEVGGDLFISEVSDEPKLVEMAEANGLKLIQKLPADKLVLDSCEHARVFHFRVIGR